MEPFEVVRSEQAPAAVGPYSQAIVHGGLVFCAGQIPLVPGTKEMKGATIEEATAQVLSNVRAVLAAAGCAPADVVKATVFMRDLNDFPGMNTEYAKFFGDHKPARSTVQVARLPGDARVEIEVLAARRELPVKPPL
ncbi:MAG: reactive intermediate/imine deaminase [Planctomycetota bacterium]|nr:deaminase [Planctomycetota bacterium]